MGDQALCSVQGCLCGQRDENLSLSQHISRESGILASSQGSSLLPPPLAQCPTEDATPATGRENQLTGLSPCTFSRVRSCPLDFACVFTSRAISPGAVRIPRCLGKPPIPLRPGPCRKEPIIVPPATERPRSRAHTRVWVWVCSRPGPVPSWPAFALPGQEEGGGGRPARLVVREKSHFRRMLICSGQADEPRVAGGRARTEN